MSDFMRSPIYEARPNRAAVVGAIRDQVDHVAPSSFGREISMRVEAAIAPLLDLVDVPTATLRELNSIVFGPGGNQELLMRAKFDPAMSMLIHVVLDQRRRIEQLESKVRFDG